MDAKPDLPSELDRRKTGAVDARQRRALARLGLASAGAYVGPTLLALRTAAHNAAMPVRIVVAA